MGGFWAVVISLAYGSLAALAHLARIGRILPGCHISLQRFSDPRTVLITIAHRSGLLIIRPRLIRIAHRSGLLIIRPRLIRIVCLIRDADVSTWNDQDCLSIRNADVSGWIDKDCLSIRNADVSGWIDKLSLCYR
jgi:hypothetical protein